MPVAIRKPTRCVNEKMNRRRFLTSLLSQVTESRQGYLSKLACKKTAHQTKRHVAACFIKHFVTKTRKLMKFIGCQQAALKEPGCLGICNRIVTRYQPAGRGSYLIGKR